MFHTLQKDRRHRSSIYNNAPTQILPMLHEGATLVLNDAPVLAKSTGVMMTVRSNQPPTN